MPKLNFEKYYPSLLIALPLLAVAAFSSANGGFFAQIANAGYGGQNGPYKQSFKAPINAAQEVPPTSSTATGSGIFNVSMDEREIDYDVMLHNENGVTDVILGCARPGQNGPTVVSLFHSSAPVSTSDYSGTITQADLMQAARSCSPNIDTLPHLVQAMREGSIYVNVLTASYPNGEIRGQLNNTETITTPPSTGTTTPPTNPPSPDATISPSAQTVASGSSIDFNGRNFGHEETVSIMLDGATLSQTAHADGGGNFTTGSITVPSTPGTYTYTFVGQTSGTSRSSIITVE